MARTVYYVVRRAQPLPLSSLNILLQEHRQLVSEWGIQARGTTRGSLVDGILIPDPDSEMAWKIRARYPSNLIAPPHVVFPPGPTDKNPAELRPVYPESEEAVQACVGGFLEFTSGKGGSPDSFMVFPNWLVPASAAGTAKEFKAPSDLFPPAASASSASHTFAVRTTHPGDDSIFVDVVVQSSSGGRLLGYDPSEAGQGKGGMERATLILGLVDGKWKIRARLMVQ